MSLVDGITIVHSVDILSPAVESFCIWLRGVQYNGRPSPPQSDIDPQTLFTVVMAGVYENPAYLMEVYGRFLDYHFWGWEQDKCKAFAQNMGLVIPEGKTLRQHLLSIIEEDVHRMEQKREAWEPHLTSCTIDLLDTVSTNWMAPALSHVKRPAQ